METREVFDYILYIGTSPKGKGGMATVMATYERMAGNHFHFICCHKSANPLIQFYLAFSAIWKLCYFCIFKSTKIVHIQTASFRSFYRDSIYLFLAKILRKKVILHLHGGKFGTFYKQNSFYCSNVLRFCDCVVVVSEYFKKLLPQLGIRDKNICVLYNSVDQPTLKKNTSPKEGLDIMFMGAINQNKCIYDIFRCWHNNKNYFEHKKIRLHICGIGEIQRLEEKIQEYDLTELVEYHGWVDSREKNLLLSVSDIYLQPSYFESLGISIIEAMSYSMPIVASRTGGIPELVEDGVNGFLILPGDVENLFEYVKCLCENVGLRQRMGAISLVKSESFSFEAIKDNVLSLYKNML